MTGRTRAWKDRSLGNGSQFFKSELRGGVFFPLEVQMTSEARNFLWEILLYCFVSEKENYFLPALMCYFSVKVCRTILTNQCFQLVYREGE